ncbi:MAG: DNA polymerase III subunit delta' [Parcubacteria group bacterium Gr01-1014_18]|nr:MAG: DNA polymerase III subunit delta' [Parcubacteria group bacterium Greene0416_36]TSC81526.1 MAG: DNA polymerase III subunit delta' [Parcubacteria group bacterium Gr01-1014_18]TSC99663.1 MAG: DNA polymerase III subunit delta' [Parcubacteria group bacterium Greene1014_20]TSD07114.1 MAG: DNA polymerase III subunit delta' [Parcubacteria group bacterium Greene0714_2]
MVTFVGHAICGHDSVLLGLHRAFSEGSFFSSYLLSGPEHIGKKTLALECIGLLFCSERKEGEACGSCLGCRHFRAGTHPDFMLISPNPETGIIVIEEVRATRSFLNQKPWMGSYKAVLVDNCHALNRNSQNAILKVLEEPRGNSVFFLVTSRPMSLLPTLRSRCVSLKSSLVPEPEIASFVGSLGALSDEASLLATLSRGKPALAHRLYTNLSYRQKYREEYEQALSIFTSTRAKRLGRLDECSGEGLWNFLEHSFYIAYSLLRAKYGFNHHLPDKQLSLRYSESELAGILDAITKAKKGIESHINSKLLLQNLFLKLK